MPYEFRYFLVDKIGQVQYYLNMLNTTLKTKHSNECTRVFNRYDASCPRCQELMQGSKPRRGWSDLRKQQDEQRLRDIRAHDCIKSNCGPVCTAFDW